MTDIIDSINAAVEAGELDGQFECIKAAVYPENVNLYVGRDHVNLRMELTDGQRSIRIVLDRKGAAMLLDELRLWLGAAR